MNRRRVALLAASTLAALLLASCTLGPSQRPALATFGSAPPVTTAAAPTSTAPLGPGGPGRQADPINWERCRDVDDTDQPSGLTFDIDCADIVVDRATTFGDQTIRVARARAPGVPDDAPPLIALLGEPGENGVSRVAAVAAGLSPAVRDHFAVLTVDLAGTGGSEAVDCLSRQDTAALMSLGVDPTEPAAAGALAELSRSLTFECGDVAGSELTTINSTVATDDLDALRDAMGEQTLTVIGRGFGATLAALYVDRYPGRVGAAVLDAPADPLQDAAARAAGVAAAAEQALDTFAASCAGFPGGCPLGADPRAEVERIVAAVDTASAGGPGSGEINGGSVLLTLLLRLGEPAGWPDLAAALAAAGDGRTERLESDLIEALGLKSNAWLEGAVLYGCNDSGLRISPEQMATAVTEVRAQAPLFGPYTVGLTGVCSSWPASAAALGAVTGTGAAPFLIIGAVDDPLSPYDAVRSLAGQLGSGTLLTWQSGQHGSYPASSCVTTAVDAYLLSGALPPVGSLCPP